MPRLDTRTLSSSIVVLLLALRLPAQEPAPAEPWRVLRAMEIAQPAIFDRDAIATALAGDEVTRLALRRPLDAETAAAIAERVRELHRRAGFVKAEATGEVQDGVLHITLAAGMRSRSGAVKCSGNTLVATERLVELLAASGPRPQSFGMRNGPAGAWQPTWVEGEPASMNEKLVARITTIVQDAYQDVGRHGVRTKISFPSHEDRLHLDIVVEDEGREVHIESLALTGEDEAQRGPVLAAVRFAPGTLATSAALADLQRQFETTGRYLTVETDLPVNVPAKLDPLTIAVTVRPGAPPFGTVAIRDAEQLRTAIDRALAQFAAGAVLRIVIKSEQPIPVGQLRILPGEVTILIDRSGATLAIDNLQWGERPAVPAALRIGAQELRFRYGEHCMRWPFEGALGLEAKITTSFEPNGEARAAWAIGLAAKAGEFFVASIHPGTAADLLAKAQAVRRDGDELEVQAKLTTVRLAADGSIAGGSITGGRVTVAGDGTQTTLSLTPQPDADELRRLFPGSDSAARNAAAVLLELAGLLLGDAVEAPAQTTTLEEALLRGGIAAAASLPAVIPAAPPVEKPPSLQGASEPSLETQIGAAMLRMAVDRRFQGELVDFGAGFGSLLLRDPGAANARFSAMLDSEEHGPLCLASAAALFTLLSNDRGAAAFRKRATERWTFESAYREAAQIGANLEFLHMVPAHVGACWRARPELKELFAGLPEGEAGDPAAWRQGLERLWTSGLGDRLREALLSK